MVKKTLIILVMSALLLQVGCSTLDDTKHNTKESSVAAVSSQVRQIPVNFAEQPKIQRTVTDYMEVSALPQIPDGWTSGYGDTIWVTPKKMDGESLKNILSVIRDLSIVESESYENTIDVRGKQLLDIVYRLNDGGQLANMSGIGINYATESGIAYFQMLKGNFDVSDVPSHIPPNEKEKQDIYQTIKGDLQTLGIEISPKYLCTFWDYKEIKNLNEVYNKNNENQIEKNWDKKDSFYWYRLTPTIDQIPLCPIPHGPEDAYCFGSYIQAKYSGKGWEQLYSAVLYEKTGMEKEKQKLITAEEAIDSMEKKYSQILSSGKIVLNDIRLEYVPTVVNQEPLQFLLVPAWRFSSSAPVSNEVEEAGGNPDMSILVNAITGDIII